MINPYSPMPPNYRPIIPNTNNPYMLTPEQKKTIVKSTALYGSSFIVGTVVAIALAMAKKLNTATILLSSAITVTPIILALNEASKLLIPSPNNKR
jgi:hypothetical protein